jgi:hypothetical protein
MTEYELSVQSWVYDLSLKQLSEYLALPGKAHQFSPTELQAMCKRYINTDDRVLRAEGALI